MATAIPVARPPVVVGLLHGHRVLGPGVCRLEEAVVVGPGADGGQQVEEEGHDVEGEDEGDDPLQHGGHVGASRVVGDGEGDGQRELDEDEDQLDPEGCAQDAVLAVFCRSLGSGSSREGVGGDVLMPRRWYSQQMKTADNQ